MKVTGIREWEDAVNLYYYLHSYPYINAGMYANVALAVRSIRFSQSKFTQHYTVSCTIWPYLLYSPPTNNTIGISHTRTVDCC